MENYESKKSFDNDLLWSKINEKLISLEKSKPFYQKSAFYYFIACTATIIITLFYFSFHNSSSTSKSPILNLENKASISSKLKKSTIKNQLLQKNTVKTEKNKYEKLVSISNFKKNNGQNSNTNTSNIDSVLGSTNNYDITNQNTDIKTEVDPVITQPIEESKSQHVIRKITVVKRQVIEKDSIVTTKRLRKH